LQGGEEKFSELAQEMLGVIAGNPPYIAGWHICGALGANASDLDCSIPGTKYDEAKKELINAGLIEELPNLGCRYRVTEKYKNAQSTLQGESEQSMIALQIMATQKEQEERIQSLEQLVREWRDAYYIPLSDSLLNDLQERTNQLLGE
jgi:hypothetical protein